MAERPFAGSAVRNAPPLLEVLQREFRDCHEVLEIGSGTGQHAVAFAAAMPHLEWQTSDLEEHHAGMRSWIGDAGIDNVRAPLALDVRSASVMPASVDAVFSANTAHIMGIDAVRAMFSLVGDALRTTGVFCLYGPFRIGGSFNTAILSWVYETSRSSTSLANLADLCGAGFMRFRQTTMLPCG